MHNPTPSINSRFWHDHYPVAKKKFVGVLPPEVKEFHAAETEKMKAAIEPGKKYLFMGAGDGREVEPIADMDIEIWGVDYVPGVVEEFKEKFQDKPNMGARVGTAQDIPFDDDTFDGVFLLYNNLSVLGDKKPLLNEINRVLKPGGFLFGTTYNEHAKEIQAESYKGLDMKYLTHNDESVTVVTEDGITYTSERFTFDRLKGVFDEVGWDVVIEHLTRVSWKYVAKKNYYI